MISPGWITVFLTVAIQLIGYGALIQTVRDLKQRVTKVEGTIDKWRDEGIPVRLQTKAHSAHGG